MLKMDLKSILNLLGELRDGSETVTRFRNFLEKAKTGPEGWRSLINECLDNKGDQFNWALQDIVNMVGSDLGFDVVFGKYRSGYDGLWRSIGGKNLAVDTKTTTAYQIRLSTMDNYIKQSAKELNVDENDVFGLFVIGTGLPSEELEAAIRGSKYRSKIRVISCDSLVDLLKIMNENDLSHEQIIDLMLPFDSINLSRIVDIIKKITIKKREEVIEEEPEKEERDLEKKLKKPITREKFTPQSVYKLPILEALIEMGGSGRMRDVLDKVYEKMKDRLTSSDLEKYSSGSAIRWVNYAQFSRHKLKEGGYLRDDSPRGIWEISEKGRTLYNQLTSNK